MPPVIHGVAAFGDRILLVDCVLIAVKIFHVQCHTVAERVVPGPSSDAIPCVDRRFPRRGSRAEIRTPHVVAGPFSLRQRLTMGVRTGEPTQVAASAEPTARNEESGHRFRATHRQRGWSILRGCDRCRCFPGFPRLDALYTPPRAVPKLRPTAKAVHKRDASGSTARRILESMTRRSTPFTRRGLFRSASRSACIGGPLPLPASN
jgi:hypothetical protein